MARSCWWLRFYQVLETSKTNLCETTLSEKKVVKKEMGFSQLEFFRQFKFFAKSIPILFQTEISLNLSDSQILIQSNELLNLKDPLILKVQINLTQLSDRSIGSLIIPRLLVQFSFYNCTELQQKEFIKKFDISFQRGGG